MATYYWVLAAVALAPLLLLVPPPGPNPPVGSSLLTRRLRRSGLSPGLGSVTRRTLARTRTACPGPGSAVRPARTGASERGAGVPGISR